MKTFFLSRVLYKQHMCDIFEPYDVSTVYTREPKILTFASLKSHEFIFTRHVKYLCCFTSTIKINKPFKRIGQGQTSDFQLQWRVIKPACNAMIRVQISFNIIWPTFTSSENKPLFKKYLWEHKLFSILQQARRFHPNWTVRLRRVAEKNRSAIYVELRGWLVQ